MYRLTDIVLSNWYLIRREQIRIRGAAALVGPTGAGKSTIFDAVGTVLAGNNASRLALNASASGRSARTVRDYCLGWISDPAEGGRRRNKAADAERRAVAAAFDARARPGLRGLGNIE